MNNSKLSIGDKFQSGVMLEDGRIFWGSIQTVKRISNEGKPIYRPKWGKIDKIATHWRLPGEIEYGGKSSSEKCECKETWKPCIISLKAATQVNAVLDEITKALLSCSWLDDRFSGEGCPGKRDSQKDCDGCSQFDVDISHVHSVIESLRQNTQEGDGDVKEDVAEAFR